MLGLNIAEWPTIITILNTIIIVADSILSKSQPSSAIAAKPIHLVVHLKHDDQQFAHQFARKHDLRLIRKVGKSVVLFSSTIGDLSGHFMFEHSQQEHDNEIQRSVSERLHRDRHVNWHLWQYARKRVKRDGEPRWTDPWYHLQWYLNDNGGNDHLHDMGVRAAWALGYTGKGSVVTILDDGLQTDHPDLAANYDPKASTDINGNDNDPTPTNNGRNAHGTRCAGQVSSVAGNNWCGVGVAYNASIGGIRMLDGGISDSVEAAALSLNQQHIDIYSSSWGPDDDGVTVDGPGRLVKTAFTQGITTGRGGKGNIFIWASGNGGVKGDVCSCDGYSTAIETLSVGAVSYNHQLPWYSEQCPSIAVVTYSSHSGGKAVTTTDVPNTCTNAHTGTSAAAPHAAGIVALALEANTNLTWRDVQHLSIRTADPSQMLNNSGWVRNSVGRYVSNKFGYGLMNAERLVRAASRWSQVPEQKMCTVDVDTRYAGTQKITGERRYEFTQTVNDCVCDDVNYLEHVQVIVNIKYSRRGDLQLAIVSPEKTRSILLSPRKYDYGPGGFYGWKFLTLHHWGEHVRGNWTLTIENRGRPENFGTLYGWSIIFYGTIEPAQGGDPTHPTARNINDCPIRNPYSVGTSLSIPLVLTYMLGLMFLVVLIIIAASYICKSKKKVAVDYQTAATSLAVTFSSARPNQVNMPNPVAS